MHKYLFLFILLLLFFPGLTYADFYRYVDENGREFYVTSYDQIPEEYRDQVEPSPAKAPKAKKTQPKKAPPEKPTPRSSAVLSPRKLSGLLTWFKADVLKQALKSKVKTWPDSGPYKFSAVQPEIDRQPLLVQHDSQAKVVRFDGKNDFMMCDDLANRIRTAKVLTAFYVASVTEFDRRKKRAHYIWSVHGDTWTDDVARGGYNLASKSMIVAGPGFKKGKRRQVTRIVAPQLNIPPKQLHLFTAVFEGPDVELYIDGVRSAFRRLPWPVGFNTADYFSLGQEWDTQGPSDFLNGDIAEFVLFGKALSKAEREGIENDLARRYKISLR